MKVHHSDACREPHRVTRLVLSARAFDETLGCGGLLAKYGSESAVALLTEPDERAQREFIVAQETLGYSRSFHFGLPIGHVGLDVHGLVGQLRELLSALRPVELYVPQPSFDQDRVAVFEAGMQLALSTLTHGRWVPPTVLMYSLPTGTPLQHVDEVDWRICEPLTDVDIERKAAAAQSYQSDRRVLPETHQDVKAFARKAGSAGSVRWAERFAVIRSARRFDQIDSRQLAEAV